MQLFGQVLSIWKHHYSAILILLCMCGMILYITCWKILEYQYSVDSSIYGRNCTPRKNVVFLKTHKCASSAIQNLLMRHAYENNLVVVLPVTSSTHYLSHAEQFNRQFVSRAPWKIFGYNVFCHHTVFNQEEIEAIMPKDSLYVTIMRDPVSLFESLYEYGSLKTYYNMTIEDYAKATTDFFRRNDLMARAFGHLGRNQMLYDLGIPWPEFIDAPDDSIDKYIEKIEKRFDLVMIAEHFDESLALLQELLCWKPVDMVVFPINARKKSYKVELSKTVSDQLREWNSADDYLYKHFYHIFKDKVKEFGQDRMQRAIGQIRAMRSTWFNACVDDNSTFNTEPLSIESGQKESILQKIQIFQVKEYNYDMRCKNLVRLEIPFTNMLRMNQAGRVLREFRDQLTPDAMDHIQQASLGMLPDDD